MRRGVEARQWAGLGGGGQKGGFKTAFDLEIAAEIDALIGPGAVEDWDFEAIETAARHRALARAARAVEQRINADRSDGANPTTRCDCSGRARLVERRRKQFQSVLGPLKLERAYYHCAACGAGFCPRDRALGLDGGSLSPAVLRMVGKVGAMVSFEEGHELLVELADVEVATKQVERYAEALGREIARDEQEVVEPPADTDAVAPTLYLGMDGTGVPVRANELARREGKQADGSAKTREVKLVTVWSAEHCDEDGIPVRDPGSVSYSAAIESAAQKDTDAGPSPFAARVEREARRRGFDRASRRVVLGDGAKWIWNIAEEAFPDAIQIVDRFHAKQHLSDVAKSIYGADSDLGKLWERRRHQQLDAGNLRALQAALRRQAAHNTEAAKCLEYIDGNRARMRYDQFHAAGLCTSTGVVEAGCKTAIGVRCKRAGMHWTVAGVDAIIALRCSKLSGRFEDFWERRDHRRAA